MNRDFFVQIVGASIALSLLHVIGSQFELYLDFWWYDIMMHTLGGFAVGGLSLIVGTWVCPRFVERPLLIYVWAIVGAIGVGVAWEAFEFVFDLYFTDQYVFDTTLDLVMDIIGAVYAARTLVKRARIMTL